MPTPVISGNLLINAVSGVAISSYQIVASNTPTSYAVVAIPTGLSLNTATGVITGTPTVAGQYQVIIEAINGSGTGFAVLNINVAGAANAAIYNDGGVPLGGQIIQFDQNGGVNYILEDIQCSSGTKEVDSMDSLGRLTQGYGRAAYIAQKIKGSATVQLPTSTSTVPTRFWTFTAVYEGANKKFVVTEKAEPNKSGDEIKVTLQVAEVLNP